MDLLGTRAHFDKLHKLLHAGQCFLQHMLIQAYRLKVSSYKSLRTINIDNLGFSII